MNLNEVINGGRVDFSGIPQPYFLLGLLSAFDNRFQSVADRAIGEISWKQYFAVICISMCKEPPTVRELSDILGSSHQNVKQILLKLEKKGFVAVLPDPRDKRKQRITLTESCLDFCEKSSAAGGEIIGRMFGGVSDEQLRTTIETIIKIESNLKEAEESL